MRDVPGSQNCQGYCKYIDLLLEYRRVRMLRIIRDQANRHVEILPQREELLFDALHAAGVETVFVAGEYGANPWDGWPACLGSTVLRLAKNGFAVRGVEGAVFPSAPPEPVDDVMVDALYRNPVSFDTALTAAARS